MTCKTHAPPPATNDTLRQHLKVCEVCGQIYDLDYVSEVDHHKHRDGAGKPAPIDTHR